MLTWLTFVSKGIGVAPTNKRNNVTVRYCTQEMFLPGEKKIRKGKGNVKAISHCGRSLCVRCIAHQSKIRKTRRLGVQDQGDFLFPHNVTVILSYDGDLMNE